jgi:hypothetical protein
VSHCLIIFPAGWTISYRCGGSQGEAIIHHVWEFGSHDPRGQ